MFAVRDGAYVAGDRSWMTSEQLARLHEWLRLNRPVLLAFWDSGEWDHQDAIDRLQKV